MAGLKVPIVTLIMGEGGSGGALGVGMGNRVGMLSRAYFGVVRPRPDLLLCVGSDEREMKHIFLSILWKGTWWTRYTGFRNGVPSRQGFALSSGSVPCLRGVAPPF